MKMFLEYNPKGEANINRDSKQNTKLFDFNELKNFLNLHLPKI